MDEQIDQASTSVHSAVGKFSEAARPATNRIVSGARLAIDTFAKAAAKATGKLSTTAEQFNDPQERSVENARNSVRARPLAALGIAVAAGFLFSRLLHSH